MNLSTIETKFLDCIIAALGSPYVWGGKGDRIWTPKGIIRNPFGVEVFDCSGLITTMLHRAGGPDWRFTHGAKDLEAKCVPLGSGLNLRFYPGHVSLRMASGWGTAGPVAIIEAGGGGRTTLAPTARGRVRLKRETRADFRAEGSLSALLASL